VQRCAHVRASKALLTLRYLVKQYANLPLLGIPMKSIIVSEVILITLSEVVSIRISAKRH
jgi:hypothetical protein